MARAPLPFPPLVALGEPLLLFILCQDVIWVHSDGQTLHISAVLTVAPGLAVNLTVTPASADIFGRGVILQTPSK